MTDPSKLLFGSFTADETRSLLNKSRAEAHEKKMVQTNTVKAAQLLQSGDLNTPAVENVKNELGAKSETKPLHNAQENGNAVNRFDEKVISKLEDSEDLKLSSSIGASTDHALQKIPRSITSPSHCSGDIAPRGLINSGNLCFLNATLQALLSCPPFVQLLLGLRSRGIPKAGYPTLAVFADFIDEFGVADGINPPLQTRRPFRPTMFECVLKKFSPDISSNLHGRPRQEDAQEFLSFLMDQMHDELLKLDGMSLLRSSSVVSSTDNDDDDDGWETVGPKNKSAVTRTQSFLPSELSSIFGGQLRSVVKAKGNTASATVQPFLLLNLDISREDIRTVEDALYFFSAPETLNEYRAPASRKAGIVSARKAVNIQSLPKIMILHLKRFSYGVHGSTKLHKPVYFPLELVLNRDLLVSPVVEGRKYELVATITHHGSEASKGHYTADARRANDRWLRFDDASVQAVPWSKVLHDYAYLLFYRQV